MNKLEIKTIVLNTLFSFASTLMSTFVSVYLYVHADSLVLMTIYTIIRIALFPPSFIIGSKISKKYNFTITYSIGLLLVTCSLLYILFGSSLFSINKYYILIAAFITGVGEGFYYFSSNTCNQVVSTAESRAKFLAYNGIFNNVTCVLAPFVSNLIINKSSNDMIGYRRILILTVFIFITVILTALTINKKSDDKDISILSVFSLKEKVWRDHQLGVFFYGFANSLSLTLTSMLIFNASKSGDTYSKLQIMFAIIAVVSYRLISRRVNRDFINKTYIVGLFIRISSTMFLVIFPNMFGAIYYGVANALASVFYDNTYNYLSACIIGKHPDEMTARVVARETSLSLGRCIGMGFVVLCSFIMPDTYVKFSVMLLSLFPILVALFLFKYK